LTVRPAKLVVVVGTGTEVGKTWVSASLLACSRSAGMSVAARKPAQSFEPGSGATDAEVLASATGEEPEQVCPSHRWYGVAYAPPMAADFLGRPEIHHRELLEEIRWPQHRVDLGVVEMAGGVASPQAHDGEPLVLLTELEPDRIVLVSDAGLGTINATTLSLASIRAATGEDAIVVVNRFDPGDDLHRRNLEWLKRDAIDPVVSRTDASSDCGHAVMQRIFEKDEKGTLAPPSIR
jgi:dethiobiotin synthetase